MSIQNEIETYQTQYRENTRKVFLFSFVLLCFAAGAYFYVSKIEKDYAHTQGIVSYADRGPVTLHNITPMRAPVVRYTGESGRTYFHVMSDINSFFPYKNGDIFDVIYKQGNEEHFFINNYRDLWLWIYVPLGFALLGFVLGYYLNNHIIDEDFVAIRTMSSAQVLKERFDLSDKNLETLKNLTLVIKSYQKNEKLPDDAPEQAVRFHRFFQKYGIPLAIVGFIVWVILSFVFDVRNVFKNH